MDILDLLKEFVASTKGSYPGNTYILGARTFAEWVKSQKGSDRFCDCSEVDLIYLDNTDNLTKCSNCEKPIWAA